MRNLYSLSLLLITATSILGCVTQLTESGSKISLVTASSVNSCDVVTGFTVRGFSNDDALNIAFNKTAQFGGDSMSILDISDYAEITAAALICLQ